MLENDMYLYYPTMILKDRAIQICMEYTDAINPLMWSRVILEVYIQHTYIPTSYEYCEQGLGLDHMIQDP